MIKEHQSTTAFYRTEIAKMRQTLADDDARGVDVLNSHDNMLGKRSSGGPKAVVKLSKTLLRNHLSADEKQGRPSNVRSRTRCHSIGRNDAIFHNSSRGLIHPGIRIEYSDSPF